MLADVCQNEYETMNGKIKPQISGNGEKEEVEPYLL